MDDDFSHMSPDGLRRRLHADLAARLSGERPAQLRWVRTLRSKQPTDRPVLDTLRDGFRRLADAMTKGDR